MVGSAVVPDLTNGQPALWSPEAIALLRSYGYKNSVVYSDSLTAAAVPGALDTASVSAWKAGVDVAVIVQGENETESLSATIASITARTKSAFASGELNKHDFSASTLRVLNKKGINPCTQQK